MGEIIQLPTGRRLERLKNRDPTAEKVLERPLPSALRMLRTQAFIAGAKRSFTACLHTVAAIFFGAAGQLLLMLRGPIRSVLVVSTIAMLVSLLIQWVNGWPDRQLVMLSLAGLVLFPALAGACDLLVERLCPSDRRFRAVQ